MKMCRFTIITRLFFIFATILLLPNLFSLTVSIEPKNGLVPATAYQYEVVDFIIKVRNDTDFEITDVGIKVSVDPGLKIVEGYDELEFKIFKLPVIGPKELREEEIKIKPIAAQAKNEIKELQITAEYGISSLTDYSKAYILVADSPLQIDARLVPGKIIAGEDASIVLNVSNSSKDDISNLTFELIGNDNFYLKETAFFSVAVLKEKESIADKQLDFKLVALKTTQVLILKTTFVDSIGEHVLQENFTIEQTKTKTYVYILIAIILVLIAFTSRKILQEKRSSHQPHDSNLSYPSEKDAKEPDHEEDEEESDEYLGEDFESEDFEAESRHKHH